MLIIIIAIIGMCIGSFINVIIYRLNHSAPTLLFLYQITMTRSRCPHCKIPLASWHLIPIFSWLLLRGNCYYCHQTISIRYLYIELLCALLFTYIAIQHDMHGRTILLMLLTGWFILLSVIDIDDYILPDYLTLPLLGLGLIVSYLSSSLYALEEAFIGCTLGFFLLWLPATLFKYIKGYAGLGGGDIKLLAALGAWVHYSQLPLLLVIATSSGILYAISYCLTKKIMIKKLPFGPFLLFAGWLILIH